MKQLKDIAGRYKELTLNNMLSGPWKPVYRTGNLYNRIASSNTTDNMVYDEDGSMILTINYAPMGGRYGKWVHDGTRFMVKREFAKMAAESSELKRDIDDFIQGQATQVVDKWKELLKPKWASLPK